MTRKYCRAYQLRDLRQFSGWTEKREEHEPELSDDDIVYLWDDFTVVRSPVLPKGILFEEGTAAWQEFCTTTLQFTIPEDLRYAYEQGEDQHDAPVEAVEEQNQASM